MDGKRDAADSSIATGPDVMSYPSPTVDNADTGPYYLSGQISKEGLGHEGASGGAQEPQGEHELGEQELEERQLHDTQDQTTPHGHQSRPSVSAEELQLAAQLTQGLAPMMAAHNQAQEEQLQAQEAEMQNSDPTFQNQPHGDSDLHDLQNHLQTHDHDLHGVLPHTEQPAHYTSGQHIQPHMPLAHLSQQYHVSDGIPPRKRSKVSRACDECRRKKIKCDAPSENGEEPCTNCRKSSARCLFSRVPQKRGPSKGYIKELADRIHSIEKNLGGGSDSLDNAARRASAEVFSSSINLDESRKRPFASISGDSFSTPVSSRHAGWASEPRPIQPYQTPASSTPYNSNVLAPPSIGPKSDRSLVDTAMASSSQIERLGDIDDVVFEIYLSTVHPAFPVLATTKYQAQSLLAVCPILLQQAFLEAFYALVQGIQVLPEGISGDSRLANRLLADWEAESHPRTSQTDLVYLQTLILMVIETDGHGPASVKGQHGGPSKASVIGRAIGIAYSMDLHRVQPDSTPDIEVDEDAEHNVALRAWWTLVMLDRWNAIGAALPTMIPNSAFVIVPGLKAILGEAGYTMLHLSNLLGHFVPMVVSPPKDLSSGAGVLVGSFTNLAMESFRLNLPPTMTPISHPVVHLGYWHCRLLAYLFSPASLSTDVLWASKEAVSMLTRMPSLMSPLNHHFSVLASLALLELSKMDKTRDEANKLLKDILESNISPSPWDGAIRDRIAEKIRPTTSSGIDAQSLQHLADLATATELTATALSTEKAEEPVKYRTADDYADMGFDPRPMLQAGYLNAFAAVDMTQASF